MRFLGPHSAGEGPHLVPISLKFGSPSGPHFEKGGSPCKLGAVLAGGAWQARPKEKFEEGGQAWLQTTTAAAFGLQEDEEDDGRLGGGELQGGFF